MRVLPAIPASRRPPAILPARSRRTATALAPAAPGGR